MQTEDGKHVVEIERFLNFKNILRSSAKEVQSHRNRYSGQFEAIPWLKVSQNWTLGQPLINRR